MATQREQVKEVLEEALAIIEDEDSYTNVGAAIDKNGKHCATDSPDADRFNAFGAITRVGERMGIEDATIHHARVALESTIPMGIFKSLGDFTRHRTHAEVVKLFENTIERIS